MFTVEHILNIILIFALNHMIYMYCFHYLGGLKSIGMGLGAGGQPIQNMGKNSILYSGGKVYLHRKQRE